MESIVNKFAFPHVPCSYHYNLPYLSFVGYDNYKIPIRLYIRDENLPTILMCHANAEDIGQTNPKTISAELNANICTFDYAGYGMHSCKKASEDNCKKDVLCVYHHLVNIGIKNIVIHGRSIGTGVACYLAYYLSCKNIETKLILVSAFKSVCRTMFDIWQPWDILNSYSLAKYITCPTLFIHGCKDNVTPYLAAKELASCFPNVRFVAIHGADHHLIFQYQHYIDAIKDFISN